MSQQKNWTEQFPMSLPPENTGFPGDPHKMVKEYPPPQPPDEPKIEPNDPPGTKIVRQVDQDMEQQLEDWSVRSKGYPIQYSNVTGERKP